MSIPWPNDVNQDVLRSGYAEEPQDNAFIFAPDAGAPIGLSRTIANTEQREFDQWFTLAEYQTLKTWRRVDLANGVLEFTRTDPLSGETGTFVFASGGFRLVDVKDIEVRVSFKLIRTS